jgi:formamidopyrimidine-DNA glycosylase
MQLKIQIEQYNKQRDQQRTKAAELHEVEKLKLKQNAKLANKQIQKFQSRDNELLQAKKQLLQKNLQGKNKKNVWLERIKEKVIVEHNPERVYQLTTTWKERQKSAQNIKTSPVSIEIPRKYI